MPIFRHNFLTEHNRDIRLNICEYFADIAQRKSSQFDLRFLLLHFLINKCQRYDLLNRYNQHEVFYFDY